MWYSQLQPETISSRLNIPGFAFNPFLKISIPTAPRHRHARRRRRRCPRWPFLLRFPSLHEAGPRATSGRPPRTLRVDYQLNGGFFMGCNEISKNQHCLVGGFNPSEKYESQLGLLFPIYGKSKKSCSKPPTSCVCVCLKMESCMVQFTKWSWNWGQFSDTPVDLGWFGVRLFLGKPLTSKAQPTIWATARLVSYRISATLSWWT